MSIKPRLLALQGVGFALTPIALAIQGLLLDEEEEPPLPPPVQVGAGGSTYPIGRPFQWVPFNPVHARRPKKRRHADIVFL